MHRRADTHSPSLQLLDRSRNGDLEARDRLFDRYLPILRRWARGRLPAWARDLGDTEDAIQDAVMRTLSRADAIEIPTEAALHGYLREAVLNRIRDEMRRLKRRPPVDGVGDKDLRDRGVSPLEAAIGAEAVQRYDTALARLSPEDRELVITRVELGSAYAEMAETFGKPSANAARMAVSRALSRLAIEMRRGR